MKSHGLIIIIIIIVIIIIIIHGTNAWFVVFLQEHFQEITLWLIIAPLPCLS